MCPNPILFQRDCSYRKSGKHSKGDNAVVGLAYFLECNWCCCSYHVSVFFLSGLIEKLDRKCASAYIENIYFLN